ncbi:hypothetical protein ACFYXC_37690 [Streptomyces sp. NPDC002701]
MADALAAVLSGDTETAAAYRVADLAVDVHHRDIAKDVVHR